MSTRQERRKLYRTMTTEEIINGMPLSELRQNARKGGVLAIAELDRRMKGE